MPKQTLTQLAATAYVECALWAGTDDDGESLDANYSTADFDSGTFARAEAEVKKFLALPGVAEALCRADEFPAGYGIKQVGHDLWLTRNGHGAGFWDRGLPEPVGDVLTNAARSMGEQYVVVGDDDLLYIEG